MEVIKVDPRECTKWKYADRSFFEYGDPNILAEDIRIQILLASMKFQ